MNEQFGLFLSSLKPTNSKLVVVRLQYPLHAAFQVDCTELLSDLIYRHEIMGRNCRFLQGPGTDMNEIQKIQSAIRGNPPRSVTVTLLNYRRNGTPFWNCLCISPIRGSSGEVVYFIGVHLDVSQQASVKQADPLSAGVPASKLSIKQKLAHSSVVGKVKIAVRSLAGGERGLRREAKSCELPRGSAMNLS